MAEDYKQLKDSFVKNLTGTTFFEVSSITSYAPISCLLYFAISRVFVFYGVTFSTWSCFIIENILLVLPGLLVVTVFEGCSVVINATMLASSITLIMYLLISRNNLPVTTLKEKFANHQERPDSKKKQYISIFRAFMNILTVMSILAVDFIVFPRRLAKVEVYGTGLMDSGIGLFICSHAIVSRFARESINTDRPMSTNFFRSVSGCIPLIIIGLLRLISVKASNYREHVTEYGVHWNFFFTLAFVKILSSAIISISSEKMMKGIGILGMAMMFLYQYLLSYGGLANYIRYGSKGDGSRHGFLDANREGIISCIGHTALFFIAIQLARQFYKQQSNVDLLKKLIVSDLFLWLCTLLVNRFVEPVSRQMANASYILWIISLNGYLLICFLMVEIFQQHFSDEGRKQSESFTQQFVISPRRSLAHNDVKNQHKKQTDGLTFCADPLLVQAISRNQLLYFLLGNLLTGIVNLSVRTVQMDTLSAMFILVLYLLTVNAIIVLFHIYDVTLKFW